MKQFACASLGHDCTWRYIANTEDLLTDIAALHLREAHGMTALGQDMVGRIKNMFTAPSASDAARAAGLVIKEYKCNLSPQCNWRYIAQTEDLLADGVAIHAREAHGVMEFTPEMIASVKRNAREWKM